MAAKSTRATRRSQASGEPSASRGNSQFVPASAELAPRADPFSQKSALLHFPYPNGSAGELPAG